MHDRKPASLPSSRASLPWRSPPLCPLSRFPRICSLPVSTEAKPIICNIYYIFIIFITAIICNIYDL
jgi:hypothetical protein